MEKKQERLSSGISGLDEMLGGGFLAGRNYLVIGEPGTGKTTFCTQFVFEGFLRNEKAIFITLDQTKNELLSDMIFFGWDFVDKQAEGLLTILDFYDILSLEPSIKITIGSLERGLRQATQEEEIKIDRLVIDPVSAIDIGINLFALPAESQ